MKVLHKILFAVLGAGYLYSGITLAGDLDRYKAIISLVNNGGTPVVVSGCNAVDKDENTCHVFSSGSPLQINPGSTVTIGDASNKEHSSEGYFVFSEAALPDLFHLSYKFDKKLESSSLDVSHTHGNSAVTWVIDDSTCTSSSGDGGIKCCTYKAHKHHLYTEYEYNCVLPVRAQ
ncbi:hypothetical protein M3P05_10650 [Sansalvadorimonas sp. 2012CJ34-2]|uniref:Uncharacterized protein n=1 Tax=Parendozoicomonas callyspongiae TaxID=2942213 RepID=A0ABT0PG69_9GAMM|nr:hypothetical protein [Sansalvadorimonas sp. 2012CJ34-2]MCL6270379.1 hypothetical protein [Sansalvadorimonas sp. 2012CJ34-2]